MTPFLEYFLEIEHQYGGKSSYLCFRCLKSELIPEDDKKNKPRSLYVVKPTHVALAICDECKNETK